MALITLKSLHAFLRLLENAPELQRRMPTTQSHRTIKEGMVEIGKLVGIDSSVFNDPHHIAAIVGSQRFVMIGGEPSATDHISRVFENTKVLLMVLIEPGHFVKALSGQMGQVPGTTYAALPPKTASPAESLQSKAEQRGNFAQIRPVPESGLE